MRFTRPCLLALIVLICHCCIIPAMAGEETKEGYFYDIYAADVNGADGYFDNEYMGSISNGVLRVCVISEKKQAVLSRETFKKRIFKSNSIPPETGR